MVEQTSFVPMGQYDECSVFIDGVFAKKRKLEEGGDYDLINDSTHTVIQEVHDCLRFKTFESPVSLNVIRNDEPVKITLEKKQAPYPEKQAKIENMCGIFNEAVHKDLLKGACQLTNTVFGMNHELYHTMGNVTIVQGRAFFKGCRCILRLIFLVASSPQSFPSHTSP